MCVVIFSEEKKCEIKNIVTIEKDRGKGYGRYMIHYICEHYCSQYDWGYMKKTDAGTSWSSVKSVDLQMKMRYI